MVLVLDPGLIYPSTEAAGLFAYREKLKRLVLATLLTPEIHSIPVEIIESTTYPVSKEFVLQVFSLNCAFREMANEAPLFFQTEVARSPTQNSISSAPTEILELVFLRSVEFRCSPRVLAQVCRHWYQITISSPCLWSFISITTPKYNLDRSGYGQEICTHIKELEQTLSRAKSARLSVEITGRNWDSNDLKKQRVVQLFQRLFNSEVTSRIIELNLQDNLRILLPGTNDWNIFDEFKFASLRKISISHKYGESETLLHALEKAAPNLEEFVFEWTIPTAWVESEIWGRIKRLTLSDSYVTFAYSYGDTVDAVLPQCHSLQYLCSSGTDWPNLNTPNYPLKELKVMILQCHELSSLGRLQLPALTQLRIVNAPSKDLKTPEVVPQVQGLMIDLPELITLDFTAESAAWLAAFYMPKLQNLTISTSFSTEKWDDECLSSVFTTKAFPTLRALSLRMRASDSAIIDILPSCPNVYQLRLMSSYHRTPLAYGQKLLHRLASPGEEEELLPQLRTVYWGDHGSRLYITEASAVNLVQQLLDGRKERGRPLEKVAMYREVGFYGTISEMS